MQIYKIYNSTQQLLKARYSPTSKFKLAFNVECLKEYYLMPKYLSTHKDPSPKWNNPLIYTSEFRNP